MFFTLLIPAWNCETTIERLLNSVVAQNEKDLNVIVVDDSDNEHQGLYENYLKQYEDKLQIEYYKRRDDIYTNHNPGNTRHDLVRRIPDDTKYVFFMDCDDDLNPGMLPKIKQFIIDNKYPEMVFSEFDKFNGRTLERVETYNDRAWLHGNFYKRDFLIDNEIQFPVNLPSHEDIYFNLFVDGTLAALGKNKIIFPEKFYNWYERDESTSHRDRALGNTKYEYIETHMDDYITSAIYPNLKLAEHFPERAGEIYIPGAISGLLVGYFYFQGSVYRLHSIKESYQSLKKWTNTVIETFNISREQIVEFMTRDPLAYDDLKKMTYRTIGPFIERESVKDFFYNMKLYD